MGHARPGAVWRACETSQDHGETMRLNKDLNPRALDRRGPLLSRRAVMAGAMLAAGSGIRGANAAGPQGELVWAIHTSLAPTWFDPAETPGIITPFMVL